MTIWYACNVAGLKSFMTPEIEKRQASIAQQLGFELHEHALALYGNCTKADCVYRKKNEGKV